MSQGFRELVRWFDEHRDVVACSGDLIQELCGAYHAYAVLSMASGIETQGRKEILAKQLEGVQQKNTELSLRLAVLEEERSEWMQERDAWGSRLAIANEARDQAETELVRAKETIKKTEEELELLQEVRVDQDRVCKEAVHAMDRAVSERNLAEISRAEAESDRMEAYKRILEMEQRCTRAEEEKRVADAAKVEASKHIDAMLVENMQYRATGARHMSEADKLNGQLTVSLEHERKEKEELLAQLSALHIDRGVVQTNMSLAERTIRELNQRYIEDSAVLDQAQTRNQKLRDELKELKLALHTLFPELPSERPSFNDLLGDIDQQVSTLISELRQIICAQCLRVFDAVRADLKFDGPPLSLARRLKYSINECIQTDLPVDRPPVAQARSVTKRRCGDDGEFSTGSKQKRKALSRPSRGARWQAAVANVKQESESAKRLFLQQEVFYALSKTGEDLWVVCLGTVDGLGPRLCSLLLSADKCHPNKLSTEDQAPGCHCNYMAGLAHALECQLIVLLTPSSKYYHSYGTEHREALYVLLHQEGGYFLTMVKRDQSPSACMWVVNTELTSILKRLEHLDTGCGLLPEHRSPHAGELIGVQIEHYKCVCS